MATVKDALDVTTRTIDRRARAYRDLVVVISITWIAAVVWAAITWSGLPLLILLSFVPLCAGFFVLDSILVNRWRDQLLRMWVEDDLDFSVFASSIAAIRFLPTSTLRAMLASLPCDKQAPGTARLSKSVKQALAMAVTAIHSAQTELTIVATLSYLLAVISVAWAAIVWSSLPLLGCLVSVAIRLTAPLILGWRLRRRLTPDLIRWKAEGIDLECLLHGSWQQQWLSSSTSSITAG
jgi:hypothetical protein